MGRDGWEGGREVASLGRSGGARTSRKPRTSLVLFYPALPIHLDVLGAPPPLREGATWVGRAGAREGGEAGGRRLLLRRHTTLRLPLASRSTKNAATSDLRLPSPPPPLAPLSIRYAATVFTAEDLKDFSCSA
jgi:hypothetical protein